MKIERTIVKTSSWLLIFLGISILKNWNGYPIINKDIRVLESKGQHFIICWSILNFNGRVWNWKDRWKAKFPLLYILTHIDNDDNGFFYSSTYSIENFSEHFQIYRYLIWRLIWNWGFHFVFNKNVEESWKSNVFWNLFWIFAVLLFVLSSFRDNRYE